MSMKILSTSLTVSEMLGVSLRLISVTASAHVLLRSTLSKTAEIYEMVKHGTKRIIPVFTDRL